MFLAPRNNDTTAEFSVTQSQSTLTPNGYLSKKVILWWFQNIFLLTGFLYLPARRNTKLPDTIRLFQLKKLIMRRTHHFAPRTLYPDFYHHWDVMGRLRVTNVLGLFRISKPRISLIRLAV